MDAVLDEPKPEVKKRVIAEDLDTKVVRFQNLEQRGIPLEFSAGAPISQEIRNYVLKDGLVYNLPRRLREHIVSLSYPRYKDIEDPNFPGTGATRSMQDGVVNRFALSEVEGKNVTVYEHTREKLNCKVLPGALQNSSNVPDLVKNSSQIAIDRKTQMIETENTNLVKANDTQAEQIKDLMATVGMLKADIRNLKKD